MRLKNVQAQIRYFLFKGTPDLSPAGIYHTPLLGEVSPGCIYPVTNPVVAGQLESHPHYEEVKEWDYNTHLKELAADLAEKSDDASSKDKGVRNDKE